MVSNWLKTNKNVPLEFFISSLNVVLAGSLHWVLIVVWGIDPIVYLNALLFKTYPIENYVSVEDWNFKMLIFKGHILNVLIVAVNRKIEILGNGVSTLRVY